MKKLNDLAPKIVETETGREIPFEEYLADQAGNGELFTPLIGKMLEVAASPLTSWQEADDLLAPIAREIISEAVQLDDKRIYRHLVAALQEAWQGLCFHPDIAAGIAREYFLNESSPDYEAQAKALAEDMAFTKTIVKIFEPVPTGGFRAVAGYPVGTPEGDSRVAE